MEQSNNFMTTPINRVSYPNKARSVNMTPSKEFERQIDLSAVEAPRLTVLDRKDVIQWYKQREIYITGINERNSRYSHLNRIKPVSLIESLDLEVLESVMWELGVTALKELNDENISSVLKRYKATSKNRWMPQELSDVLKDNKVGLRYSIHDGRSRVLNLVIQFQKAIKENYSRNLDEKEMIKEFKKLVYPEQVLKMVMADIVTYEDLKPAKSDFKKFTALTMDKMEKYQSCFGLQKCIKGGGNITKGENGKKKYTKAERKEYNKKKREEKQSKKVDDDKTEDKETGKGNPPAEKKKLSCWSCKGPHHLKDCTTTSDEKKKEIVEKKKVSLNAVKSEYEESNLKVYIERTAIRSRLLDTGASETVIPPDVVEELEHMNVRTNKIKFDPPILVTLAKNDSEKKVYIKEALDDVNIVTQTQSGGKIQLPPHRCYILPGATQVLIGKRVLREIGIDVEQQLDTMLGDGDDLFKHNDEIEVLNLNEAKLNMSDVHRNDTMIKELLQDHVDAAVSNGFPESRKNDLQDIVNEYKDVFDLSLADREPAKVPPLKVKLKSDAVPQKAKSRKYPPIKSDFLCEWYHTLCQNGLMYENFESRWASCALPVRKNPEESDLSKAEFRATGDYRQVNKQCESIAYTMPNVPLVLNKVKGSKCFFWFDLLKGYWQLPLHEDSQEILSIITDISVFTPKRVPQGFINAGLHFQSCIEMAIKSIGENVLHKEIIAYQDDVLGHYATIDDHLEGLKKVLECFRRFNFVISAKKVCFYDNKATFCGRNVNEDGIFNTEKRIKTLTEIPYPTDLGQLQQFVCSLNWIRNSLIDYARISKPLYDLRQKNGKGSLKKKLLSNIKVQLNDEEKKAFDECKALVAAAVKLHHPDDDMVVCLITDASDIGWACCVTGVSKQEFDDTADVSKFNHVPLMFLSGTFKGAQARWSMLEKECYAIMIAFDKLEYLFLRNGGIHVYTDHRNLVFLFNPTKATKVLSGKLARWSTRLIGFEYIIHHVPGELNIFADMLSRWANPDYNVSMITLNKVILSPYKGMTMGAHIDRVADNVKNNVDTTDDVNNNNFMNTIYHDPSHTLEYIEDDYGFYPSLECNMIHDHCVNKNNNKQFLNLDIMENNKVFYDQFPTYERIINVQKKYWINRFTNPHIDMKPLSILNHNNNNQTTFKKKKLNDDAMYILVNNEGKIRIPDDDKIKTDIFIAGHYGAAGHRGKDTMKTILSEIFDWSDIKEKMNELYDECIYCIQIKTAPILPTQYQDGIYAKERNEILHMDYIYIGESENNISYLLMLKDNYSKFIMLFKCEKPSGEITYNAFHEWISLFGVPKSIVSDQGSHFKFELLKMVCNRIGVRQTFTLPYCPWLNGTIERLGRTLLDLFKLLILETKTSTTQWDYFKDIVQTIVNHTPTSSNDGFAPVEIFTGLEKYNKLNSYYMKKKNDIMDFKEPEGFKEKLEELKKDICDMHQGLNKKKQEIIANNKKKKKLIRKNMINIGDFVLWSRVDHDKAYGKNKKLLATWIGPFQVVDHVSFTGFKIRHLISGKCIVAHQSRLKFYSNKDLEISVELKDHIFNQGIVFEVEAILNYKKVKKDYFILVKWKGIQDIENSWEPMKNIKEDTPQILKKFMNTLDVKKDKFVIDYFNKL